MCRRVCLGFGVCGFSGLRFRFRFCLKSIHVEDVGDVGVCESFAGWAKLKCWTPNPGFWSSSLCRAGFRFSVRLRIETGFEVQGSEHGG